MTLLTEELQWTVNSNSCGSGIFLRWQNDLGAIDQWLFTGNISNKVSVSDVEYFEKNIDDMLNITTNFEVIKKQFGESKTVYTTFDKDNAEGFKQLLRSKNISMYVSGVWVQVDVSVNSFDVKEENPLGKISIDIILPKIYVK